MPVPTLVTDLSTTLASNSPAGSDNVFPSLDDYLRSLSGFIASIRDNSGNGWVSPYLPLTYSAGTANGVVYLNGSKVVTTGSALTFDGTNLGIGTSSPSAKLHVAGTFRQNDATSTYGYTVTTASSKTVTAALFGGGYFAWQTNASGTDQLTLDSSGNLGLGVTPSAWSVIKAIEIGGFRNSVFSDNGSVSVGIASGSYYNSGWKYALTGSTVGRYEIAGSSHQWFTAPSGTAGNAISFTQAMTLTSAGDLLVGTGTVSGAGGLTYLNQGATGFASINNNNAGATGYVFSSYRRSSVEIGSITQNGTTAVLFNTTSDRRLKDNIVPAPSASDVIDAIEIVSHDWKAAPDEHVTYGVIAQDLALVVPQAVLQGDDGDEIEKTWGVDYSKLVPMLIKEIQSLRARVAALEAA